ncbi:MAG TPA: hypothetical protein DEP67_07075 [Lachnospiraceae bacterium]|nr:hypothetical protein [Lachnospiraceae bacterium]
MPTKTFYHSWSVPTSMTAKSASSSDILTNYRTVCLRRDVLPVLLINHFPNLRTHGCGILSRDSVLVSARL